VRATLVADASKPASEIAGNVAAAAPLLQLDQPTFACFALTQNISQKLIRQDLVHASPEPMSTLRPLLVAACCDF
jgi:hypothetical protein